MIINSKYWLMITAITISLLIWFHYTASQKQTAIITLPIEYINLSDDLSSAQLPEKSRFRIVANGYDILKLILSGSQIQYDGTQLSSKNQKLDSRYYLLSDVFDNHIDLIEPILDEIPIETMSTISANVIVELNFANNESRQLFGDRMYKLLQNDVTIRGPESLVRSISSVKTQPITATMLNKAKINLALTPPNKQIELLTPSIDLVRMDEQTITKVITRIKINPETGYDFFPKELTVRISGVASMVNSVTSKDIRTELVVAEQRDNQIPVNVKAPSEIEILDFSPQKVTLKQ